MKVTAVTEAPERGHMQQVSQAEFLDGREQFIIETYFHALQACIRRLFLFCLVICLFI